ncbi:NUDIX hydrolase [Brachyspira hyodysenteriae]|uniref:NUDIX domain-containing protein n=1 Tax=Brachyspira hyodysenteriae TaxID=159 RepID=UPI00063DB66B|nr:NUDIX domain-containing protein [Brachyspira hyodysenteriae]KLI40122.1 NUDIX hydrolase [Brachyspira hyodysenteriae]
MQEHTDYNLKNALKIKEHIKYQFKYCPYCGEKDSFIFNDIKIFQCSKCKRTYFTNPASAVGVVIETPNGIVFVERKFEPKKGYIDMPGGFCEPYERAEDSAVREVFEETNIKLNKVNFLISGYNEYIYDGIMYITTDIFFYSNLDYIPETAANDDASKVLFIKRENIDLEKIAFESAKEALSYYINNF